MREGVAAGGGELQELERGVIDTAEHTLIVAPDRRLLSRLHAAYPDLDDNDNVDVIDTEHMPLWLDAIETILTERGIPCPTR